MKRLLLLLALTSFGHAAEEPDPTLKLREQLRAVTLQLRTAQTDGANAKAAQAAAEQKAAGLEKKLADLGKSNAALAKQAAADQQAAETARTALERKLAERDQSLQLHKEAIAKWQDGYQKAAAAATATEQQRAALASQLAATKHTLADRERKNLALFNTANEILDRYGNHALGKAILAREPFIGTTRVKIENLVQDYQDKILDNRISAKPNAERGVRNAE